MICPECNSLNVRCVDSRLKDNNGCRYRTYFCDVCHAKYHTKEVLLDVKSADSKGYIPVMGSYVDPKDLLKELKAPIERAISVIETYERFMK